NGVSSSGYVGGATAADLSGTLSYGGTAQGAVDAGSYTLTASGLSSGNYTIGYVAGTLTIDPAALTVEQAMLPTPFAPSQQRAGLAPGSVLSFVLSGDGPALTVSQGSDSVTVFMPGSYDTPSGPAEGTTVQLTAANISSEQCTGGIVGNAFLAIAHPCNSVGNGR
ncbi:MAG: MBG domain-containing protein, partial [Pseudodonghicola sp.]